MSSQDLKAADIAAAAHSDIEEFIVGFLAQRLDVDASLIEREVSFDRLGVDSVIAVGLTSELGDRIEKTVQPTLLYKHTTVSALSRAVEDMQ